MVRWPIQQVYNFSEESISWESLYEEPFVINRIIGRKRGESSLALLGIPKYFSQTNLWPSLRIFEFMATRNSVKIFFLKPIKRWLGWKLLTNLCWEKRSTVHWGLPIKPFWANLEIYFFFQFKTYFCRKGKFMFCIIPLLLLGNSITLPIWSSFIGYWISSHPNIWSIMNSFQLCKSNIYISIKYISNTY